MYFKYGSKLCYTHQNNIETINDKSINPKHIEPHIISVLPYPALTRYISNMDILPDNLSTRDINIQQIVLGKSHKYDPRIHIYQSIRQYFY